MLNNRFFPINQLAVLVFGLSLSAALFAQQAPDAGQTLRQEQQQAPQPPAVSPRIESQVPQAAQAVPGGTEVEVRSVSVSGNSVFAESELLLALGEFQGQKFDFAGLQELANKISVYYRSKGYLFARAYLPAQEFRDSALRIEVIEGRFGAVSATGDESILGAANAFLTELRPGDVITGKILERATLILVDQPGIKAAPILRPGQEVGLGDLDVYVERTQGISGDLGYDNHGNRYTGEHRVRANLQWDSPFTFGDQLSLRGLYSSEDMWLGSLGYSLPLGGTGLRGIFGYSHTYYELGKEFAVLGATGTAKVTSVGLSYPLIRSQAANLTLSPTLQHKNLDDQLNLSAKESKSSDILLLALNFDRRDQVGGGGVTYGVLSLTSGRLKLDSTLQIEDRTSGQNTRGSFNKVNLDLSRVQATPVSGLVLFGRVSAQWAEKNLDSSEGFGLGGANGVRAYPRGEGTGDKGWIAQAELRYAFGDYTPYVFYDTGLVSINAETALLSPAPETNRRSISGAGAGLRYQKNGWNLDASLAWRTYGGAPESDTKNRDPRLWVSLGYAF